MGGPDATPNLWKQLFSAVRASGGYPGNGNSPLTMNSPHKGPVTRKMFPFDDGIMNFNSTNESSYIITFCISHKIQSTISSHLIGVFTIIIWWQDNPLKSQTLQPGVCLLMIWCHLYAMSSIIMGGQVLIPYVYGIHWTCYTYHTYNS